MLNTARMARRPRAVHDAWLAKLTPEQRAARRFGYELTPEQAEFFVHHSERYAHLVFLADRDALPDTADEDAREREYRRERVMERATPFGRVRHLLKSREYTLRRHLWRRVKDLPF